MRILIGGIFVLAVATVFADPVAIGTKSEVQAARGLIEDLVQSGTSADELLTMANESTKGAERFWLYWNAFILRAKDGNFAEATDIIKSLRANVTGVPDADIVSLIERNARKGLTESAELAAILKESKIRVAAQKLVAQLKKDVQKNPKDDGLKVTLAEALAVSGDWDAALKAYAETKLASATVAKLELANKKSAKIAAFWWDYKPCRTLSAAQAFKVHAAGMYTELIKTDVLSALEKILAEKRIVQFSEMVKVGEEKGGVSEKTQIKKPSADVKKNELAELKKVCNSKGLVHRWSFNGDAKDSVGGVDAEIHEGVFDNGQCFLQGGWITLNRAATAFSDSFTIEVWVTELKSDLGACVFRMMHDWNGDYNRNILRWATAETSACTGWIHAHLNDGSWFGSGRTVLGRVTIGEEYYAAMTVCNTGDGFELAAYRYVPKTGKWFRWSERRHNQELMKIEQFELGPACCREWVNITGSYNECRVWTRCLSSAEIEKSAKSGPDKVN